jgi:hypothetical protein
MEELTLPAGRGPRLAGAELLVLAKWEELTAWLLHHTAKWPKARRFTLTQRVENHALDIIEALVTARYDRRARAGVLRDVNLRLERLRFLLRIARAENVAAERTFESTMRRIDEVGRMLHGWRKHVESPAPPLGCPPRGEGAEGEP